MNVYDFDKTIYDGDSTVDFFVFCIRRNPRLLKYIVHQGTGFVLYLLGACHKTRFKELFFSFLRGIDDAEPYLKDFWDLHLSRIKPWYIEKMRMDDVIISASPDFLVREAMQRLGNASVIASMVDLSTGHYTGTNCHGQEKVRRFFEIFPDAVIDEFYSDSVSDTPLGDIAGKFYIVKGDTICWKN